MIIEDLWTVIYSLVGVIAICGVIGAYKFFTVINITGDLLAREEELLFEEKDELTQSKTKGAYWCEGCYSWQLPVGHDEHIESCDCPY